MTFEDKHHCPHCGGKLHGRRFVMSTDADGPGFIGYLAGWFNGERGLRNYIVVTAAVLFPTLLIMALVAGPR